MHEKLPKDSQFYKFFMNKRYSVGVTGAGESQLTEDKELMKGIKDEVKWQAI